MISFIIYWTKTSMPKQWNCSQHRQGRWEEMSGVVELCNSRFWASLGQMALLITVSSLGPISISWLCVTMASACNGVCYLLNLPSYKREALTSKLWAKSELAFKAEFFFYRLHGCVCYIFSMHYILINLLMLGLYLVYRAIIYTVVPSCGVWEQNSLKFLHIPLPNNPLHLWSHDNISTPSETQLKPDMFSVVYKTQNKEKKVCNKCRPKW